MSVSSASTTPFIASDLEIKRLLLVDDDSELADTLKSLLEAHNFVVTTVCDGSEALREIVDLDFDVILCDIVMPKMAGDLLYLAVRKAKPHLAARFLFITGHSEEPKVEAFLKSIDALVVLKPVLADELLSMISLILQRTASPRQD